MDKNLYIWHNNFNRTCFGITGNLEGRKRNYEGHCGHAVQFDVTYVGPQNHIEDLEDRIKGEFYNFLVDFGNGKKEWINEEIETEHLISWIDWEIENTYEGMIVKM